MKTITFQHQQYIVPEWAKFIACDSDSEVWVFDIEPTLSDSGDLWCTSDNKSKIEQVVPMNVRYIVVACQSIE